MYEIQIKAKKMIVKSVFVKMADLATTRMTPTDNLSAHILLESGLDICGRKIWDGKKPGPEAEGLDRAKESIDILYSWVISENHQMWHQIQCEMEAALINGLAHGMEALMEYNWEDEKDRDELYDLAMNLIKKCQARISAFYGDGNEENPYPEFGFLGAMLDLDDYDDYAYELGDDVWEDEGYGDDVSSDLEEDEERYGRLF